MFLMALLAFVLAPMLVSATVQPPARDGVATFLLALEQAAANGDGAAIMRLCATTGCSGVEELAATIGSPRPTRVIVKERDRAPLDNDVLQLVIEVFTERGIEGRLGTWRLDVTPGTDSSGPWRLVNAARLSGISGLYRLSLNTGTQYDIRHLTVRGPDLALTMAAGTAFVAETPDGITAVVLLGRSTVHFAPPAEAERTQLRLFAGHETLSADLDAAFIRVRPDDFASVFDAASLLPRAVSPADLRRAAAVFDEYVGRTLQVDLTDLSRDRWSLVPGTADLIVEMRTRRLGSLTYARSGSDAEDISLFERRRRRNISVYASPAKLAARGPFYSEDDLVDYDVLAYDIDTEIVPDRDFITGNARLKIRVLAGGTSTLTFRLAESLVVRGVYSPAFGRLLHLRVIGQNSVLVNFPAVITRGMELWLDVGYSGRLPPQSFNREAISVQQDVQETAFVPVEPQHLFSNRTYWYPQSTVTDYATAKLRITVPADYEVIATGDPLGPPAPPPGVVESGRRPRATFVFDASRPARYLACIVSRFTKGESRRIAVTSRAAPGAGASTLELIVRANPRQASRARDKIQDAASILEFYGSLMGDAPYPTFTLAVAESDRPGGHSPPYFAVLNQVVSSTVVGRNDPVSFETYPTFYLAHEIAHQWWGHAVGWKNYHEQWISEGFAQYFAALYAERARPGGVFSSLLRQMRRTAIAASAEGPVHLGYRLGHVRSDERVFRAVVYNKGAMVLHMLRRMVGDETFFAGLRGFYEEWKFRKAGTDDFRKAMEKAGAPDLGRFFEAWVYGATIPRVAFGYRLTGGDAVLRFEQNGDPVDIPLSVTVTYASGRTSEAVVVLSERVTTHTLALAGPVRSIAANADHAALVEIDR